MINASFPKCIMEVIHSYLSIIAICLATDSDSILNGTQNTKINRLYQCQLNMFSSLSNTQFYDIPGSGHTFTSD